MKQNKKQLEEKNIVCPKYKSNETIKWCKRKTENRGLIQRYKCKSCNKYFTLDLGFFRMRNNPIKITQSIDLFYRGVSTRKVQEHLGVFYPHNASNVSIYKCNKCSHVWFSRGDERPLTCPKCKSARWDKESKKRKT